MVLHVNYTQYCWCALSLSFTAALLTYVIRYTRKVCISFFPGQSCPALGFAKVHLAPLATV